jgi:hypothetical protein
MHQRTLIIEQVYPRQQQRRSGLRLNTFARRFDVGTPVRRMVALVLQALQLRWKQRQCRRHLRTGRPAWCERPPQVGSTYHALCLHNPGVCLMLADEPFYRLSRSTWSRHLDVKAMLRPRNHPIRRVNHVHSMARIAADDKPAGRYLGRRVIRFSVATCRKNSARGCAGLPSRIDPAGASEITPA